ncbi:phosphotransferase family protein [Rhizobium sp. L1K21]|uniref:phosphotransferase family protein n=1 Tax=Rhizobium sp. L1K21 TaxID=2954933 RepID=UPI0020926641|nr:phosphotransferase family protein [Rhizobium sp. L1K21]MCO6188283.1 phosphotransferase family protein [Rhizobium sp. L1K21]
MTGSENPNPHALDRQALEGELANAIAGFGRLLNVEKFSGGQSNPTYRLKAEGGDFVLRAKPPGKLLASAHQVDREYRVMKALADTDVPVPEMLYLSGEDSSIGRMFFVMRFVEGRIIWDPVVPDVSNEERAGLYDNMNKTLAALHSVDVDAVGLGDYGKPGSYFERQINRWAKQYRASEIDKIEDMDWLIDWLEKHDSGDDGQVSLVHGDFRIDNMIFANDDVNVLAILDWELSTLGHPLADLAYQCMHWRLPHKGSFRGLGGVDRASLGLPSEADYVRDYCSRRGIDKPSNWVFALAFSFFRAAAIVQGVVKRAADGNASNPEKARALADAVPLMARMARDLVNKGE